MSGWVRRADGRVVSAAVGDARARWSALRRSVLLVQGARENAHEAVMADRSRAEERRRAAHALTPSLGDGDPGVAAELVAERSRS